MRKLLLLSRTFTFAGARPILSVGPDRVRLCQVYRTLGGGASPKSRISGHYSPECVEGVFSEVRLQDPACIASSDFRERRGSVSKH
jgi:hypothetical protein